MLIEYLLKKPIQVRQLLLQEYRKGLLISRRGPTYLNEHDRLVLAHSNLVYMKKRMLKLCPVTTRELKEYVWWTELMFSLYVLCNSQGKFSARGGLFVLGEQASVARLIFLQYCHNVWALMYRSSSNCISSSRLSGGIGTISDRMYRRSR